MGLIFNMTRALVLALAVVLLTADLAALSAQARRPRPRPIPNLNGLWDSDEEGIVTVFQSGNSIRVMTNRLCGASSRPFYMQGTLSAPNEGGVMTISNGIMHRCESQHPIIQTCCGPRITWQTSFKAEIHGDYSIVGDRHAEHWYADVDSGGAINPATCKKEYDFDDPIILLRPSPTAAASATPSPPASPSPTPGPSPSPTPGYDYFDDVWETLGEMWQDTVETVEDIPDASGFTESWETFKKDPGGKRVIDAWEKSREHSEDE